MILKLLSVLKSLKNHSKKINLYEHAFRTMTCVSEHTVRDEIIVAALLHKAKQLLRADKWEKCKQIMVVYHPDKLKGLRFAGDVEKIIDQLTPESSTSNNYRFLREAFKTGDKTTELILLSSILTEVSMNSSIIVNADYAELINELTELGRLDASDDLICEIRSCILSNVR